MNSLDTQLRSELRQRGLATARELTTLLGISQPSLSRLLGRLPPSELVRVGRARSTRYGLHLPIGVHGSHWPLYEITPEGKPSQLGELHALENGLWHLEQEQPWESLRYGDFDDGVYPGLPWFLDDLRPRGFLGRIYARHTASALRVPDDPRLWRDEHVVAALLKYGSDLPGAFFLGEEALRKGRAPYGARLITYPEAQRQEEYPRLAAAIMEDQWPGSSAAGEQPKFPASILRESGQLDPVIVKFSGPGEHPANRRRADLLIAEHLASRVLATQGLPVAASQLIRVDGRVFHESSRFDRVGGRGYRRVISLLAFDAAHYGEIDSPWTQAAQRMRADGWLDDQDADRLSMLWWFGILIGNTDMHYGNASLFLDPERPLRLAPVYDMLPMLYQPNAQQELPPRELALPLPPPEQERFWWQAAAPALSFWEYLAADERVSRDMREIAARNAESINQMQRVLKI